MPRSVRETIAGMRASRGEAQPSMQAFSPVDVDAITRKLDLVARGAKAGKAEQPASDAVNLDETEHEIRGEIEQRGRKAHEEYAAQLGIYAGRIQRAIITTDKRTEIDAAGQGALSEFVMHVVTDKNHLHTLQGQVEDAEQEYNSFRAAHGLTRPPRIVSTPKRVLYAVFLLILLVIESVLNGLVFAKGSTTGVVGGVAQAVLFSVLNVGASALFGLLGLPLLRHRAPLLRLAGVVLLVFWIMWLIGLNLSVGHFRDLFVQNQGNVAMADFTAQLVSNPLRFQDVMSLVLVVFGMGLGIVAVLDVAGWKDPYPGYGSVGARRNQAISRYAVEHESCLKALTERRDSAVDDMQGAIEDLRADEYEVQLATEGRQRLHRDFAAYLEHLGMAFDRLISRYRDANRSARSTPAPEYFRRSPDRPATLLLAGLSAPPTVEEDARRQAIDRIQHYIHALNSKYEESIGEYRTVGQLTNAEPQRRDDSA